MSTIEIDSRDHVDEDLESLADEQTHLLVSPYPGLSAPIVAGARGAQQSFQSVDDDGIRQFITTFQQGAQTPEPGAPCSGGFGEPD